MADNEIEIDTDIEFESIEDFVAAVPLSTSKPVRTKIKSRDALVELALMHAVLPPLRRRLKTGKIKALIVKVPDPS